jgi:hypothetical protein
VLAARSNFLFSTAMAAGAKLGAGCITMTPHPPNCVLIVTVRMSSECGKKYEKYGHSIFPLDFIHPVKGEGRGWGPLALQPL